MTPIPLMVELCAGTAALSVRLAKAGGRPVISRMGAKTGYADRILELAGLRPGQGADLYLWCEPDPGARLLLEAYRSQRLAREAAAIVRSWADEDPRALWQRLKAEGPARHEVTDCSWRAAYFLVGKCDPRELARVARLLTSNRLINLDSRTWENTGEGGSTFGGPEFCTPIDRLEGALQWAPEVQEAVIRDSAISPPPIPPGSVVYIDPPYVGTTGYAHDLPRAEVVRLAREWAEAGALVMISEAQPIVELDGWHVVEITGDRKGQTRTFSKQKREFVTMSAPPAASAQPSLFQVNG